MSDVVKVIFDGDISPLEAKQAIAKGELNAFVTESEASIKGIAGVGDAVGVSSQKGAESFSRYYKPVINDLSRQIQSLGPQFEKVLGAEATKETKLELDELRLSLQKLNNTGYEATATDAEYVGSLKLVQKELASYQLQLAEVTQQHIFLAEAETASGAAAAESATLGNLGARPLQGFGGAFRAAGVGVSEIEANAALQILGKLGIAISTLVVEGGVAAVGLVAVEISTTLRKESEHRLETEEGIAGIINKQNDALYSSVGEYAKIVEHLREAEQLSEKIKSLTLENDQAGIQQLRNKTQADNESKAREIDNFRTQVALEEKALEAAKARPVSGAGGRLLGELGVGTPYTASQQRQDVGESQRRLDEDKKRLEDSERQLKVGTDTLSQLDKASKDVTGNQDKAFSDSFESLRKSSEERRKFEEEQEKRRVQSVKEGNEEVLRLTKGYKDEFDKLYLGTEKDNPFATQMTENAKSVQTLEERLKGVTPELKRTALALLETANAQQTYTIQINSAFQTIDFRGQADRFRNPTQKERQTILTNRENEFQRTSNSTNPDVLYTFQKQQEQINNAERERQQGIIDQKLDVAGRAKTDDQKAIADKAVTSFASGLNPDDLTQSERSRIADSYERSAVRNESRQEEALKINRDLLATLRSIDKRGEDLSGIVAKGGKQALDITVKDQTSGGIETRQEPKAPNQDDTKALYQPDLLVGGSGGLSNN